MANSPWSLPIIVSDDNAKSNTSLNTESNSSLTYVFTPAGFNAKLGLCLMLGLTSAMGFSGNCFLLLFLWNKNAKARSGDRLHSSRFMKNLNLSLRNLALSDLMACAGLPLVCIQVLFDVFQSGFMCKVVRYLPIAFSTITINIMVVVSLVKYLSTRRIPRTFRATTVKRMMITAWILGVVVSIVPSSTYDGQRIAINNTHFTIACIYQEKFYQVRLTAIFIPVQFVAPFLFITFVNVSLVRTVWVRRRKTTACSVANNPLKAKFIAARIRGVSLLIAITFAFIFLYFFYIVVIVYKQIAKPDLDFQTDYILRYASGGITCLNSSANVVIYSVQMKDFRAFLIKLFWQRANKQKDTFLATRRISFTQVSDVQLKRFQTITENTL